MGATPGITVSANNVGQIAGQMSPLQLVALGVELQGVRYLSGTMAGNIPLHQQHVHFGPTLLAAPLDEAHLAAARAALTQFDATPASAAGSGMTRFRSTEDVLRDLQAVLVTSNFRDCDSAIRALVATASQNELLTLQNNLRPLCNATSERTALISQLLQADQIEALNPARTALYNFLEHNPQEQLLILVLWRDMLLRDFARDQYDAELRARIRNLEAAIFILTDQALEELSGDVMVRLISNRRDSISLRSDFNFLSERAEQVDRNDMAAMERFKDETRVWLRSATDVDRRTLEGVVAYMPLYGGGHW